MINFLEVKKFHTYISSSGIENSYVFNLSTDSRKILPGQDFLALSGERFNALNFLEQVKNKKIRVVIYDIEDKVNEEKIRAFRDCFCFLKVSNTLAFLQEYSTHIAKKFISSGRDIIAITGSNGKTTTREMLFHILKKSGIDAIATQANNNNHIGVPLTLLQINKETQIAVVELGSNHPGEIKTLCEISQPTVGVTTNIGATHLEFFDGIEDVFREESFIHDWIRENGKYFFKNKDDDFLKKLESNKNSEYGLSAKDYKFLFEKSKIIIEAGENQYEISNAYITGKHNFTNLAVAFILAQKTMPSCTELLLKAAQSFKPTSNRSQWKSLNNTKIFLDAYNANPSSMLASLCSFTEEVNPEKSLVVLGDMNELGSDTKQYHGSVASEVSKLNIAKAIFIGKFSDFYRTSYQGEAECYETVADYKKIFKNEVDNYNYVFIKGSRSLQLESLLDIT